MMPEGSAQDATVYTPAVNLRPFRRAALYFLLAVSLVLPGIAAPAQAVAEAVAPATAASAKDESVTHHDPCDGMGMPASDAKHPPLPEGGCAQHGCDLAACLGSACLPELPRIAAFVPPASAPLVLEQPLPPSRVVETPLRPPIA